MLDGSLGDGAPHVAQLACAWGGTRREPDIVLRLGDENLLDAEARLQSAIGIVGIVAVTQTKALRHEIGCRMSVDRRRCSVHHPWSELLYRNIDCPQHR